MHCTTAYRHFTCSTDGPQHTRCLLLFTSLISFFHLCLRPYFLLQLYSLLPAPQSSTQALARRQTSLISSNKESLSLSLSRITLHTKLPTNPEFSGGGKIVLPPALCDRYSWGRYSYRTRLCAGAFQLQINEVRSSVLCGNCFANKRPALMRDRKAWFGAQLGLGSITQTGLYTSHRHTYGLRVAQCIAQGCELIYAA